MKTKFLLPVLAMIFAVGMSFTTAELGESYSLDFIRENNAWKSIPTIDCSPMGTNECEVLYNGTPHKVYDTQNFGSVKTTSSEEPFEL